MRWPVSTHFRFIYFACYNITFEILPHVFHLIGLKEQVRTSAGKLLVKMHNNRKEHSICIVLIDGETEKKFSGDYAATCRRALDNLAKARAPTGEKKTKRTAGGARASSTSMKQRAPTSRSPTASTPSAFKNPSKSHVVPKGTESLELYRTYIQQE